MDKRNFRCQKKNTKNIRIYFLILTNIVREKKYKIKKILKSMIKIQAKYKFKKNMN